MERAPTGHILIVDDDPELNEMLSLHFEDQGHQTSGVGSCREAKACFLETSPDLILLDQSLPDGQGIELLRSLRQDDEGLVVVMMTGLSDLELAIEAIKQGAIDFIHKPIKLEELDHVVGRALVQRALTRKVAAYQPEDPQHTGSSRLVGASQAMLEVSKEIARAAPTDAPVLIVGESGTGKELVARAIHDHSGRDGPFVAVNSAAIVDTLLESELFGHEKGAFTGALHRKQGKFELARDGTLFLDEIGELPLPMQAKLLRVLQEGCFERVGGVQQLATNARIVTATNRDVRGEARAHRFRQDLLYRLKVLTISLPPLRDRLEDIPVLVDTLLRHIGTSLHKPGLHVQREVYSFLKAYPWPGNVRELENVLTQASVRARTLSLSSELFSLPGPEPSRSGPHTPRTEVLLRTLGEVEADHVQSVLDHVQGHKGRACEVLAISRPALDRKIAKYGLTVRRV